MKLINKGSGGLQELIKELKPDTPAFGYLRFTLGNDELVKANVALLLINI
jgi:hypothetical protein